MDNFNNFDNYNGNEYNNNNYGNNNYGNNYNGMNGGYPQNMYQPSYGDETVSILGWIGWLILMSIPCIGTIATIVLAFAASNGNVKNFARAILIIEIVFVIVAVVFSLVLGMSFATLMNGASY